MLTSFWLGALLSRTLDRHAVHDAKRKPRAVEALEYHSKSVGAFQFILSMLKILKTGNGEAKRCKEDRET